MRRLFAILAAALLAGSTAAAENLLLPVFAHNAVGQDGSRWSSELYLTNPSGQPVQVTPAQLLPGQLAPTRPCRIFMPPTRVVPPHSAVVWTASGMAADLGCAEEALGGLLLSADGPVIISSRMVRHPAEEGKTGRGFLAGQGQQIPVLAMDELPRAGSYLLPALHCQREGGAGPAFDTYVGFTNPWPEPVLISIDPASDVVDRGLRIDDQEVALPYTFEMPPESWRQIQLRPARADDDRGSRGPESIDLLVTIDGPLAFYASVVDRTSQDPRTVLPVALQ